MPIFNTEEQIGTRRVDFLVEEIISTDSLKDESNYLKRKFKYKFNTQNFKIKEGDPALDIFTNSNFGKIEKITEIDDDENYLEITTKEPDAMPSNLNLGPTPSPSTRAIAEALNKFIQSYLEENIIRYKCADDFLTVCERNSNIQTTITNMINDYYTDENLIIVRLKQTESFLGAIQSSKNKINPRFKSLRLLLS